MRPKVGTLQRYAINGLVATAAHFAMLVICLQFFRLSSAGFSNLIASTVGISMSFIGNRYFVFCSTKEPIYSQALRFAIFYGIIAFMHVSILYVWTDVFGLDYRVGFIIAVAVQFILGFLAGKTLIFREDKGRIERGAA